jgi:hypothetical protein
MCISPNGHIWVIVHSKEEDLNYPQRCQLLAQRRGSGFCDLQIGGAADEGRTFEVYVVFASDEVNRQLSAAMKDPGYLRNLPPSRVVLGLVSVTRKP